MSRSFWCEDRPRKDWGDLTAVTVGNLGFVAAHIFLFLFCRLARRADEREHLMLHLLLLTEKEVTAAISMKQQIAVKVGLRNIENSKEIKQLGRNTSIDDRDCCL